MTGGPTAEPVDVADEASRASAARHAAGLGVIRDSLLALADSGGRAGDDDLGACRGATAAAQAGWEALAAGAGVGTLVVRAGDAWAEHGGGSGLFWGTALTAYGRVVGDTGQADDAVVVRAVRTALDAVTLLRGERAVDEVLVVADPFARGLACAHAEGLSLAGAWAIAAARAQGAAAATSSSRAAAFCGVVSTL